MKVSPQQPTTLYGPRSTGNVGRYNSETPPPAARISYKPEQVGARFGWAEIISPEKRWNAAMNHCYVLTRCTECGAERWQNLTNLRSGKSKGCQSCTQRRAVPKWLYKRFTAAKQRCTNPRDRNYPNYGGRGIQFLFPSVNEACLYMIETNGLPSRDMELDRTDNDGNYEPGNLRWTSRPENMGNRRLTVLPVWNPNEWPYARSVVTRKLSQGMTREQILEDARKAVEEKRKGWRDIAGRLASMTS